MTNKLKITNIRTGKVIDDIRAVTISYDKSQILITTSENISKLPDFQPLNNFKIEVKND